MEKKAPNPSTKISPSDIKGHDFSKTVWGFSVSEVSEFLNNVSQHWDKFQKTEKELNDKVRELTDEVMRWRGREVELEKMRERAVQDAQITRDKAQVEAQKLLSEVEAKAESIRVRTEEWLEQVIQEVSETERQKNNFMAAFKSALDSHYELLKSEEVDREPLAGKLHHLLKSSPKEARTEPRSEIRAVGSH